MKQVSPKVVHFADLQRYIFTTDYTPQVAPGGKHELSFDRSSGIFPPSLFPGLVLISADATEFVDAITDLVDDY